MEKKCPLTKAPCLKEECLCFRPSQAPVFKEGFGADGLITIWLKHRLGIKVNRALWVFRCRSKCIYFKFAFETDEEYDEKWHVQEVLNA